MKHQQIGGSEGWSLVVSRAKVVGTLENMRPNASICHICRDVASPEFGKNQHFTFVLPSLVSVSNQVFSPHLACCHNQLLRQSPSV